MTRRERRFEDLQNRWARGDHLSSVDEKARLAYAEENELARREIDWYRALEAGGLDGDAAQEIDRAWVEKIMAASGAAPQPRLRLVPPSGHLEGPSSEPISTIAPRRRRWQIAGALVAVASVAAATIAVRRRQAPPPTAAASDEGSLPLPTVSSSRSELVFVSGAVKSRDASADIAQQPLVVGDRITTENGRACISIDPAIDVCLGDRSELEITSLRDDDVRVRVVRGMAVASLAPREPGHVFSLEGDSFTATARGTVFAVRQDVTDGTSVIVAEGKVEVTAVGRGPEMVPAHLRVDYRQGEALRATMGRSDEAPLWDLLIPRGLWQGSSMGTLEIGAGSDGDRATIDDRGPLTLPLRLFLAAGKHHLQIHDAYEASVVDLVTDLAAGERRVLDPSSFSRATSKHSTSTSIEEPRALLDEARRELAKGHARAGLEIYERLRATHPSSPEATTVLVTIGKLELELAAPARAVSSFDRYLRTGGPLAPEALAGKIRALRALDRHSDERHAIEQYLAAYPNGFDAPAMKQRLSALSVP